MATFDTKDLPQKGTQVRIRLRGNFWLFTQVENVAPTRTFFTLKVLGVKEVDYEEHVGEPSPLLDEAKPEGPLVGSGPAPDLSVKRTGPRRAVRDPALPPSPSIDLDETVEEKDAIF